MLFIALWGACLSIMAQHRTADDDSLCIKWFNWASLNTANEKALLVADSIVMRGKKLNLANAEFMAVNIRTKYYSRRDDFDKLHAEAEKLRKMCDSPERRRAFIFSYEMEIDHLLRYSKSLEALRLAKMMMKEIKPTDSQYIKYLAMRSLGRVYYNRRDYRRAITTLDSTLYYAAGSQAENKSLRPVDVYVLLAEANAKLRQDAEASQNYRKAMKHIATVSDTVLVTMSLLSHLTDGHNGKNTLDMHNDEKSFNYNFDILRRLVKPNKMTEEQRSTYYFLNGYNRLFANDFNEARKFSRVISNKEQQLQLQRDIYLRLGDYRNALDCENHIISHKDSIYRTLTELDIDLINIRQANHELMSKANEEENALLMMQIMQARQKQQQADARMENNKLLELNELRLAQNDSAAIESRMNKMKLKRMQNERDIQKMSIEIQDEYHNNVMMSITIFLLLCIGITMMFYTHRNGVTKRKLSELAVTLQRARDEAINTNKIQTTFIQRMNYDVRTPLNEVIGFAQLLSANEITLSDEERQQYGQHITNSAMKLNDLVAEILKLADIECGRLTVNEQNADDKKEENLKVKKEGTLQSALTNKAGSVLISMMLCFAFPQCLSAQDNVYKIDNQCYAIMKTLKNDDSEQEFLRKSEDMYNLAVTIGDTKAQTLAVANVLDYYNSRNNHDRIWPTAARLREVAKRTGHMQYYYFAYQIEIRHMMDDNMAKAMQLAKQMTSDADSDPEPYGKFVAFQQLGEVYHMRNFNQMSLEYYRKALEIAPRLETRQRSTQIYLSMAQLFNDKDRAFRYYRKALREALDAGDSLSAYSAMCNAFGEMNDRSEFYNTYDKVEKMLRTQDAGNSVGFITAAFKASFDGDYDKAYAILDKDTLRRSMRAKLEAGRIIATREGDFEKALRYAFELERYNEDVFTRHRGFEFAELNDKIRNEQLRNEQAMYQREQSKMMLENQNMLTELKMIDEHNQWLLIQEKQTERRRQREEDKARQYEDSLQNARMSRNMATSELLRNRQTDTNRQFILIIVTLIVIIIAFAALVINYKRSNKKLLKKALELRTAKTEAVDATAMKKVFIQNMSHEVRTPLNAVMGFAQILSIPELPLSDDEKKEYTSHILNNTKMLTMLVDDILNIGDIEKGNYSIAPAECSANQIMADAISTSEYRAQPGVEIYYTSDMPDDFMIYADARRVQQVLINFLTNACKHTDKGSIHLHLTNSETPEFISYSVTDTGCGIPKEEAENIFERFTKLNDFKQGTGLGLNICRLISSKMGGKVYCDTRYTGGARFVFEVPVHYTGKSN